MGTVCDHNASDVFRSLEHTYSIKHKLYAARQGPGYLSEYLTMENNVAEAGTRPTHEVQVYTVVHIYCVGEETLHFGLEKRYRCLKDNG